MAHNVKRMALLGVWVSLFASPALAEPQDYIGLTLASEHFGEDSLNEFNPGLTYGRRWSSGERAELFLEGGLVLNSYDELGPLLVGGVNWRALRTGRDAEVRLGLFAGTAYYDELSEELEEDHGIPNFQGMIPIVGVSATWRIGRTSIRLSGLPVSDEDLDGVVALSLAYAF